MGSSAGNSEDPGTLNPVLEFLSYFDRPRNAVASAFNAKPDESALNAGWEGFKGNRQTSWGDVFGIPEAKENEDWGPWLGKQGARFATDVILDPLNLLFAPAKALKGLNLAQAAVRGTLGPGGRGLLKEGQSIAGALGEVAKLPQAADYVGQATGLNKLFATKTGDPVVDAAEVAMRRTATEKLQPIREQFAKTYELEKKLPDPGLARHYLENGDVEALFAMPGGREWAQEMWTYARMRDAAMRAENVHHEALNVPLIKEAFMPAGGTALPRVTTEQGRRKLSEAFGARGPQNPQPEVGAELKLSKVRDKGTGEFILDEKGNPVVTQPNSDWIDWAGDQALYNGRPVDLVRATLKEVQDAGAAPQRTFVQSGAASLASDLTKKTMATEFLQFWRDLREQGYITSPKLIKDELFRNGATDQEIAQAVKQATEGRRMVNVPKLKGYFAEPNIADRLENLAKTSFDPDTPMGAIADLIHRVATSRPGEWLQRMTNYWKKFVLAHPGWAIPNFFTNIPMIGMEVNPLNIPIRMAEAAKQQPITIAGKTIKEAGDLWPEAVKRGIGEGALYGSEHADELQKILQGEKVVERIPGVGGALSKAGDALNKSIIEPIFQAGGWLEQNAKLAVMQDYLVKAAKEGNDWRTMTGPAREELLDRAARLAHDALIDYSAKTPFMQDLSLLIPFLQWQYGIIKRTADVALTKPQRLANVERTLEATTIPMSEDDRQKADAWVKEGGPIMGAFGKRFAPTEQGTPNMFLTARFLPWGQPLEQLIHRPADTMLGAINPYVKASWELPFNKSSYRNRAIDEVAGSFPENLFNPVIDMAGGGNAPYEMSTNKVFGQSIPAGWEYLMSIAPWGRHIRTADIMGQGAGLWTNEYRDPVTPWEAGTWYVTGGKFNPADVQKWEARREYEHKGTERALQKDLNLAIRRGDIAGAEFYSRQLQQHRMTRPWLGMFNEGG